MIEARNLSKRYGSVQALEGVSFEIPENTTVALLGPNGAGKTTLMRMLAGYLYPSAGQLSIRDRDIERNSMEIRRKTGYLPESTPVYSEMTPVSYLRYRGRLKKLNKEKREKKMEELIEVCGLEDYRERPCETLSGGYLKRLGIADALLGDPELLVLDEPTEGLDPGQVRETRSILKRRQKETTIVLSSHALHEVGQISDRFLVLKDGRLVFDGDRTELLERGGKFRIILEVRGPAEEIRTALNKSEAVVEFEFRKEREGEYHRISISASSDPRGALFELCRDGGWDLQEMRSEESFVEQTFLDLIE